MVEEGDGGALRGFGLDWIGGGGLGEGRREKFRGRGLEGGLFRGGLEGRIRDGFRAREGGVAVWVCMGHSNWSQIRISDSQNNW